MQTIREATPEGLAAVARAQEKSDLELKQARLNDATAGPELFAKIGKAQYDAESNARKLALEEADLQIKGQAQKISDLVAAGKMNVPQALRYLGKFQEAAIEVERARQNFEAERTRRMEEKARAQALADQYETEDQITSVLNAAGGKIGQAQNAARQAALAQYAGATPGQKLANMRGFDVSYQDPGLYKNTEEYKSMMAPINQEEYGLTPFQKIIEDAVAKTPISSYNPASYFKGIEGLLSPLPTSRVSSTGGLEGALSPLPTSRVSSTGGLEGALSPLPTSPISATEAVPSAFPMNTNVTNYSNALIKSPSQTANLFDNLFQDYPGSQLYNTSSAPLSQYPAILESMDTQNTYG
jgi:polyhydroxyalkanoate synthesis regulator phasin